MNNRLHWFLVTACIAVTLAGCSSTTLSGSWRSPDYLAPVTKIYIVGISKQETRRRVFEDEFGVALQAHGVQTVSSYKDLKSQEVEDLNLIKKKVKASGADALLMTRLLGQRSEEVTQPARVAGYLSRPYYDWGDYRPEAHYHYDLNYYARRYEMIYEPATISRVQVGILECNLYDTASGELIWSAQLETVLEGSLQKLIRDFIQVVIKDLLDQAVI